MQYSRQLLFGMVLAVALGVFAWRPVCADALAEAGRSIVEKNRQAVVTLQVTTKVHITGGGEEATSEEKDETIGTIIDAKGLIVTSLSGMSYSSEMEMPAGDDNTDVTVTNEVSAVTIQLEGGREIPARIVLRDKDLDLAFIRPLKPLDKPIPFIDPAAAADKPLLLDEVLLLERLSLAGGRSIAILPMRVIAVIEKPRPFYVVMSVGNNLGTPIFALDGKLIGIRTLHFSPQGAGGKAGPDVIDVIRPAADITEAAKQAK